MRRRYMHLLDGTRIPLVWDGTRWDVVDYRRYKTVGDYKRAVDATGLHFAICCAWPMDKFMHENGLTFPETYELMTKGYERAAAKHGLRRSSADDAGRLIPVSYEITVDDSEI